MGIAKVTLVVHGGNVILPRLGIAFSNPIINMQT